MLEVLHTHEARLIDTIYRRALVLQQRLLYQPEQELKRQVEQFMKEVAEEQKLYDDQWKPGEKKQVSLSKSQLLQ
jgi:hypothetical protein